MNRPTTIIAMVKPSNSTTAKTSNRAEIMKHVFTSKLPSCTLGVNHGTVPSTFVFLCFVVFEALTACRCFRRILVEQ